MRVCIPSLAPGGVDGFPAPSFEDADVFDFYDIHPDGEFEQFAQTRPCTCWGPDQAEAISRRGVEAVIVEHISPSAFLRFNSARVRVLRADNASTKALLAALITGRLKEIGVDQFARLSRSKGKY